MLRKLCLIVSLLVLPSLAYAQTNACDSPGRVKSVAVNISSATTTRLVNNASADTVPATVAIAVCGFTFTLDGSATPNQLTFISGTGATCGTATVTLSGTFRSSGAAGTVVVIISTVLPFGTLTTGQSICLTTTQAGVVEGILTYVLQ